VNKDFRVAITFADHPKTHKLMRRCGDKACWHLMRLWGFVAANKPDGNLGSMDEEDVEIAAGWNGEKGLFVSALLDLRMLEGEPGSFSVHDWTDHNEYAVHAKARSEKASAAARSRWGNAQTCLEHAASNAPSIPKQCPSPSPSPKPKEEELETFGLSSAAAPADSPEPAHPGIPESEIIQAYHMRLPTLPRVKMLNKTRRGHLRARWTEDKSRQSPEWWDGYFSRVAGCPHLLGDNGRGWTAGWDWLLNPANMLKVLEGNYDARPARASPQRRDSMAGWVPPEERNKEQVQ